MNAYLQAGLMTLAEKITAGQIGGKSLSDSQRLMEKFLQEWERP